MIAVSMVAMMTPRTGNKGNERPDRPRGASGGPGTCYRRAGGTSAASPRRLGRAGGSLPPAARSFDQSDRDASASQGPALGVPSARVGHSQWGSEAAWLLNQDGPTL